MLVLGLQGVRRGGRGCVVWQWMRGRGRGCLAWQGGGASGRLCMGVAEVFAGVAGSANAWQGTNPRVLSRRPARPLRGHPLVLLLQRWRGGRPKHHGSTQSCCAPQPGLLLRGGGILPSRPPPPLPQWCSVFRGAKEKFSV